MKRFLLVILTMVILFISTCILPSGFVISAKAAESTAPDADNITVTNNIVGTADTVYVTGLEPKDVVNVYKVSSGGTSLGKSTVSTSSTETTIKISQVGTSAGIIYVSVTSSGCTVSSRTKVDYAAEPVSDAPAANSITVTNNAKGTADTVYVCGLSPKDVVKVYNAATGGKLLGSKTLSSTGSDVTISISQLVSDDGSVYVSVKSTGCNESSRTQVNYAAEAASDTIDSGLVDITNNVKGTADTVSVSGLSPKDVIKVYNAATGGKTLGSATVSSSGTSVKISISQLGTSAGTVYISLKSTGYLESGRVAVNYDAESVSTALDSSEIIVTNNAKGTADTVYVENLSAKDVVKVYSAVTDGSLLGQATATSTNATVSITQLGNTAGSVYVSVTSKSMNESSRIEVDYAAEVASTVPSADNIIVTNNPTGTADSVYVAGLTAKDIVKVYDAATSGTILGKATATSTTVTVTITQLGTAAGTVYVSVTSTSKAESSRTEADYDAEAVSTAPDSSNIAITNNASGTADTVYVSGLQENDIVKIYKTAKKGTALGNATVASGKTYATVDVAQLGTAAGSVYITVTSTNALESSCTQVTYSVEATSTAPSSSNIIVTNNVTGTADTVYVSGLTSGDIETVYTKATQGTVLGTATVASSASTATVSITQLGTVSGSVYVTVTSTGKAESARTEADYDAEPVSAAPDLSNIMVSNNAAGTADTVKVAGLTSGDIVSVYKSISKGTALGTATVASGTTYATVSITQLGTGSGEIYVSVTSTGCLETELTKVSYSAEEQTAAISSSSVSVTNNNGTSDTVTVTGLTAGDIINVYDAATNGSLIGTATVTTYASTATIAIEQLDATAGSIYVTKISKNKTESTSTKVDYSAEPTSTVPTASNVTIANNANASDAITVIGLLSGDVVTVYKAATGSTTLGTGTVSSSSSTVTITISQLGTSSGSVYISVTSTNMSESERTEFKYAAETQSTAPSADNITVANNYLIASTITVTGLQSRDVVNVYNADVGGTVLGTGTVSTYGSKVTSSLSQLGSSGGTIYVTVTSTNESESTRTAVTYSPQAVTSAPSASDITIINNAIIADTITVKNISSGMVINIYDAETGGNLLGTATSNSTTVTVSIDQLGASDGSVYISATSTGKTESTRKEANYVAESASDTILTGNVTIVNSSGTADTITITGLSSGDVIKVYKASSGGTAITTATATGSLTTILTVLQIGTSSGSVYISVTSKGKTESSRTVVDYVAESTAPLVSNLTIVNNAGISDTITVTGLTSGDIVSVYNAASSGTLLGSAQVSASSTSATISVSQLSSSAGYVYISVTNSGCAESSLTKVSYLAEQTTDAPDDAEIVIVNNAASISDTVTVNNLVAGDLIKVYDAATSGNLLGKATVASGSTSATVTISELGTSAGSVYVSLKNKGKLESSTTEAGFVASE